MGLPSSTEVNLGSPMNPVIEYFTEFLHIIMSYLKTYHNIISII